MHHARQAALHLTAVDDGAPVACAGATTAGAAAPTPEIAGATGATPEIAYAATNDTAPAAVTAAAGVNAATSSRSTSNPCKQNASREHRGYTCHHRVITAPELIHGPTLHKLRYC